VEKKHFRFSILDFRLVPGLSLARLCQSKIENPESKIALGLVLSVLLNTCVLVSASGAAETLPYPTGKVTGGWRETWDSNLQSRIPSASYLPQAQVQSPRLAEAARQRPLRVRPDSGPVPALAWQSGREETSEPQAAASPSSAGVTARGPVAPPLSPSGPPVRTSSPDEAGFSPAWRETGPDPVRASTTTDPVKDQVLGKILAVVPELRQKPAPYLRLAIPDPLPENRVVRLQKEPPDKDAPVAVTDRSLRPVLPTRAPTAPKP